MNPRKNPPCHRYFYQSIFQSNFILQLGWRKDRDTEEKCNHKIHNVKYLHIHDVDDLFYNPV